MGKLLLILFHLCVSPEQEKVIDKMTPLNKINECRRLIYKCSDSADKPFNQEMIYELLYICTGGL